MTGSEQPSLTPRIRGIVAAVGRGIRVWCNHDWEDIDWIDDKWAIDQAYLEGYPTGLLRVKRGVRQRCQDCGASKITMRTVSTFGWDESDELHAQLVEFGGVEAGA